MNVDVFLKSRNAYFIGPFFDCAQALNFTDFDAHEISVPIGRRQILCAFGHMGNSRKTAHKLVVWVMQRKPLTPFR